MAEALLSPTTPSTPHTPGDDGSSWLRLIRSRRVGPATFHRLLAEHGSARAALAALPEIAREAGVESYQPCPVEVIQHEMAQARISGARLLLHGRPGYPQALMDLPDAPPVLWVRGNAALLNRRMVALVGARNASSLGMRMARRLAEGLGEAGFVVVSGLARGVDAESHLAALPTGTVAVQAGGVDVIYPEENAALAARIAEEGCLVSEQPMRTVPQARHFPLRNRIVSGLVRAVVVVEAAGRSGSLITARTALDQGREVLAVPGHPFDARAAGCNMLIRDGATLVRSAQDIIEALGAPVVPLHQTVADDRPALPGPVAQRRPLSEVAELHSRILSRLGPSPLAEDQLIRDLALPAAQIAPELLALELDGTIIRQPGGLLSRAV
jgi:DNA processing protein